MQIKNSVIQSMCHRSPKIAQRSQSHLTLAAQSVQRRAFVARAEPLLMSTVAQPNCSTAMSKGKFKPQADINGRRPAYALW
jgi:hypothetical protein